MNNKTLREIVDETLQTYAEAFKEAVFVKDRRKIDKKAFEYIEDIADNYDLDNYQRENLKN